MWSPTALVNLIIFSCLCLGADCSPVDAEFSQKLRETKEWSWTYLRKQYNRLLNKMFLKDDMEDKKILPMMEDSNANNESTTVSEPETMTTPRPWSDAPGAAHLIQSRGYPFESHNVVTEDGYILTVHRVPFTNRSRKGVISEETVLLHHGWLGSSVDWLIAGPKKSLGFILYDAGYDVWMVNMRGNYYSRRHVTHALDSVSFWNFTFHESSQKDLPAIIDYIALMKKNTTKISYIGHSTGATALLALLANRPGYQTRLQRGIALAPVAFMADIKSPLRCLSRYSEDLDFMHGKFGQLDFTPTRESLRWISDMLCAFHNYNKVICEHTLFVMCGFNERQFDWALLPSILAHYPAGTSTKNVIHLAQMARRGHFRMFDYGPSGNRAQYGSALPPAYDLAQISMPIALIVAKSDWLSTANDSIMLHAKLNNSKLFEVPVKEFQHLDFLWGIDAPTTVYKTVIKLLKDFDCFKPGNENSCNGSTNEVTKPPKVTKLKPFKLHKETMKDIDVSDSDSESFVEDEIVLSS